MATRDDWQRLCALIDDDPSVWQAVEAALADGDDGWAALLDGLDEAGALAYLQADDTGMELTDALAQLPRVVRTAPDLGRVTDTDELTDATELADRLLQSEGLRLVRLVEEDDSWPVVVVDEEAATEVVAIAARLGHEAVAGG